jgi:hypothetical protein
MRGAGFPANSSDFALKSGWPDFGSNVGIMKLAASLFALAFALTTFACASSDETASSDQDLVAPTDRHCGGFAQLACAEDEVCSYTTEARCGIADQTGVCRKRPQICPALVLPICGCDGKTYNNSCEAERAGASVAHDGKCEAPMFCPAVVLPVCGDDGKTYNNSCEAARAGANVAHDGVCQPLDPPPPAGK